MNNEGSEAPQLKDATLANRASEAVTEAIATFSRLLNLKPAPIVNESTTEPRPNP